MNGPAEPAKATGGLTTVLNTIASPGEAFESIRTAPTWGWAFLIAAVLSTIGFVLSLAASHHAGLAFVQHLIATNPNVAGMSDAQKAKMISDATNPGALRDTLNAAIGVVSILIAALVNAAILLIGSALGSGQADFKRLWAGSMNIAVPTIGLAQIVLGLVAIIRGADSYNSLVDLFRSIPSLVWLVPGVHGFAGGFLTGISLFALWGLFLNVMMMRVVAQTKPAIAWSFPIAITLLGAAFVGVIALFIS